MRAPLPPNEDERLALLASFEILDSPPDPAFDDLARLASVICDAPIAAISLVDRERQWLMSTMGFDDGFKEGPRETAFCAHAILHPSELLVVEDARNDIRFADNPAVRDPSNIRFYAAAPLVCTGGMAVGALCVCSTEVKTLSDRQRDALAALGRQVVDQLELRRTVELMHKQAQALSRARDEADEANRNRSVFLANLNHEIRTPMNGIIGVTGLLGMTPLSERQRNYVDMISRSGESLMSVLQDSLEYASNDKSNYGMASFPALLEEAVAIFRPAATTQRVQLVTRIEAGLEQPLPIDPIRTRQVLSRLIGTSIRAAERGAISLYARREASYLTLEVFELDFGPHRVFESHLNSVLEAVQEAVSAMEGSAELRFKGDRPDGVRIILPVRFSADAPEPVVLVAEDNEVNSLVLATMLEDRGCRVTCVENGLEAVEAIRRQRFDLVFMDIQMPGMDGLAATEEVRRAEDGRRTPIVAVTASALGGDEHRYRDAGIDDLIHKPISERTIAEALRRWVTPI